MIDNKDYYDDEKWWQAREKLWEYEALNRFKKNMPSYEEYRQKNDGNVISSKFMNKNEYDAFIMKECKKKRYEENKERERYLRELKKQDDPVELLKKTLKKLEAMQ